MPTTRLSLPTLIHARRVVLAAASIGLMSVAFTVALAADVGWGDQVHAPQYKESIFPPWQHGANNPTLNKGLEFTVPEIDDLPDFHGDPMTSELNIFVGGNDFFVMAPLVAAFEKEYPKLKGHIFYETLPPGFLLMQMARGGTITIGNMTMTVKPDVYAAGLKKVEAAIVSGKLEAPAIAYVTNDLTIMVPKGNPAHIKSLTDLGKPGVKLSMPSSPWEGVSRQIEASLVKAGGKALEQSVYETKVKDGQTILTHIHHRQTPLYLMQGLADAGVTWKSEAIFQEQAGHPISHVDIPAAENTTAVYGVAVVSHAAHPKAGMEWAEFLRTPTALALFERYGFKPFTGKAAP